MSKILVPVSFQTMDKAESKEEELMFTPMEHDACGIGTVVQIDGKKSYDVVDKLYTLSKSSNTGLEKMRPVKWEMV